MYSQNSEEQIILKHFSNHIGTFLDIGSNDGITLSNTYALNLQGWKGTCVEASPAAFKKLKNLYSHDTDICLLNFAVGSYNGEITLYESGEHLGSGDVSLLSTVVAEEKSRWIKESFTEVIVPCVNFNTMLGLTPHKRFDFISIDIEGMELIVLPQIDLKTLGCKLLCVEFNGKDQWKYDAVVVPQGFILIHKNGENLIYAKKS